METASYDQKMLECRELKGNGYFDKAATKFRELLNSQPANTSGIVIELADTLFLQGSYKSTFECLEEYFCKSTEDEPRADNAALRIMRAFARAHVQSIFQEGLELVQNYEGIRSYAVEPELADALVSPRGTVFVL